MFAEGGILALKEALDRIKQAEEANAVRQKELKQELTRQQQAAEEELRLYIDGLKQQRNETIQQLEADQEQQLQQEKSRLVAEADQEKQTFEQQYAEKAAALTAEIIGKVRKIYGS